MLIKCAHTFHSFHFHMFQVINWIFFNFGLMKKWQKWHFMCSLLYAETFKNFYYALTYNVNIFSVRIFRSYSSSLSFIFGWNDLYEALSDLRLFGYVLNLLAAKWLPSQPQKCFIHFLIIRGSYICLFSHRQFEFSAKNQAKWIQLIF